MEGEWKGEMVWLPADGQEQGGVPAGEIAHWWGKSGGESRTLACSQADRKSLKKFASAGAGGPAAGAPQA